jgi:outer membrane protein assembly factor BamB
MGERSKRGREPFRSMKGAVAGWLTFWLMAAAAAPLQAADWPQWRGPRRDGISSETGWRAWTAGGPRRVWTAQVGEGFSSVAVKGGRLYTVGNAGGKDTVYCLDAGTGRVVWRFSYPCGSGDYGGPRATPVVDGNRVYTFSREAQAHCLNAASGARVWERDLRRETGGAPPQWGFAGSPLVLG